MSDLTAFEFGLSPAAEHDLVFLTRLDRLDCAAQDPVVRAASENLLHGGAVTDEEKEGDLVYFLQTVREGGYMADNDPYDFPALILAVCIEKLLEDRNGK